MASFKQASLLLALLACQANVASAFTPQSGSVKSVPSSSTFTSTSTSLDMKTNPDLIDNVFQKYGEESRMYRRTVFTHEDWVRHRSSDRFFRNISTFASSGIYKSLLKEVAATTTVASFILVWNLIFGEYQDLMGMTHDGILHDSVIPILALPLATFTVTSPALGLLLVFRTNTSYKRWDEARKNWGMNINHTRDLVRLGSAYYDREATSPERAEEDLNRLALATWAFVRSMKRHLSPEWEDEEDFRKEMLEKLPEEQAQNVFDAAHRPNRALQDLSTAIENLPMHYMRKNEVHRAATIFEDNLGSSERLLTSPVPVFYSRHTARFLSFWLLLLPFGLWGPLGNTWNHIGLLPTTAMLSLFLFGIEELATQLEEPFTILPMQGFSDKIYNWCTEIASFKPGDNGMPVYFYDNYDIENAIGGGTDVGADESTTTAKDDGAKTVAVAATATPAVPAAAASAVLAGYAKIARPAPSAVRESTNGVNGTNGANGANGAGRKLEEVTSAALDIQAEPAVVATLDVQAEPAVAAVEESQKQSILDSEVEAMKQNMKAMEEQLKESVRNTELYATELKASVDVELEGLREKINNMGEELQDANATAEKYRIQLIESTQSSAEESFELQELREMVNVIRKELEESKLYNERNEKQLADYEKAMTAKNTELDSLKLDLREMQLQSIEKPETPEIIVEESSSSPEEVVDAGMKMQAIEEIKAPEIIEEESSSSSEIIVEESISMETIEGVEAPEVIVEESSSPEEIVDAGMEMQAIEEIEAPEIVEESSSREEVVDAGMSMQSIEEIEAPEIIEEESSSSPMEVVDAGMSMQSIEKTEAPEIIVEESSSSPKEAVEAIQSMQSSEISSSNSSSSSPKEVPNTIEVDDDVWVIPR